MKRLIIFYITLLWTLPLTGQQRTNIVNRIQNTRNYKEIGQLADQLYRQYPETNQMFKEKKFRRWDYWWSSRVTSDGNFNNVLNKNRAAISELKRSRSVERASEANWQNIGPVTSTYANNGNFNVGNGYGRVDRIFFHPTDSQKIYACTPTGGVWYSDDRGSNWECINDHLDVIGACGLVVDPNDDQTLYLLSGTGDQFVGFIASFGYRFFSPGIYKSEDHGDNWELIYDFSANGWDSVLGFDLAMNPLDNDYLIAATDKGAFISTDRGDSWVQDSLSGARRMTDIEFHPTIDSIVYLSGRGAIYQSSTGGVPGSFVLSTGLTPCRNSNNAISRIEIAVSPVEPNSVWAILGFGTNFFNGKSSSFCGVYKSIDSGVSFNLVNSSPNLLIQEDSTGTDQSTYDLAIAVDNNSFGRVLVGGLIPWINNSNLNSTAWTPVNNYFEQAGSQKGTLPIHIHPDIHDIAFNPIDGRVYITGDGGIYVSSDNGQNWTNISEGIISSQIYNLALAPSNSGKIMIGLQDNGVKVRDNGTSTDFWHINGGDGFDLAFSTSNSDRVFYGINRSIYLLPDYDQDNLNCLYCDTSNQFFSPIALDFNDPTRVYIGNDQFLQLTLDADTTLSINSSLGNVSASWEIATCPESPDFVYAAGGTDDYRNDPNGTFNFSNNNGDTFTDRTGNFGWPISLVKITDIVTLPGNCSIVAFSNGGYETGQKVYWSSDSGNNWFNLSFNLPNVPVHSLELLANGDIYAGTEIGVFRLPTGSASWIPFTNKMPRVPVTELEVNNQGTHLIAATFGRGVWQSALPGNCSQSLALSIPLDGFRFYETSSTITINNQIQGGEGTEVYLHAGNSITFETGFRSTQFSKVRAKTAGCGTPPDIED